MYYSHQIGSHTNIIPINHYSSEPGLWAGPLTKPTPLVATATVFHVSDKQSWLCHVLPCAKMPRVSYALEQWVFMYNTYAKTSCVSNVRQFRHELQDMTVPHRASHAIINKLWQIGLLLYKEESRTLEEKLDINDAGLDHFTQNSLPRPVQETRV
jgi:hypothetical protein